MVMAKPYNAIEFKIHFDLSEVGFEKARSMIHDEKAKRGHFKNGSDNEFFSNYCYLRVASQNMGQAIVMRVYGEFYIEPSFTYSPDEWSLHEKTWNKKIKKYDEIIIWSSGA